MSFKYRLERVLELREEDLDKAKLKYQKANEYIRVVEGKITANTNLQMSLKQALSKGEANVSPKVYYNRINHLKHLLEQWEQELVRAKEDLQTAHLNMMDAQQKLEALKKHKENARKEFLENERLAEEKELNELALTMRRRSEDENEVDDEIY